MYYLPYCNRENILHLSPIKAWFPMVALTVKNGNDRLKKGIGDAEQKFGLLDTAFWRSDHNQPHSIIAYYL